MEKDLAPGEDSLELVQKRKVRRFKLSNVFSWILDGFNMDHGAFYTLKNLIYRPGEMVRSYLYLGRLDFTPPIRLLLVTTTLVLIAFKYSSISEYTFENIGSTNSSEQANFNQYYLNILEDYTNVFLWLLIPNLALFSWLFNRKSKYNFAENLVLNTYYTVFANISYLMFFTDRWIGIELIYPIYLIVNILHYVLCLRGMFEISWFKALWQSLLILVLSLLFYFILLSLTLFIILKVGAFTPPQ